MSPFELRELLTEIKVKFPDIKKTFGVVDDSMLANKTADISNEDNFILVGVLPNYTSSATNGDNVKDSPVSQLLLLEKTDYSNLTDDEFWELFQRTYLLMKSIREWIIDQIEEGCLPYLRFMEIGALDREAVWKKAECNGYSLDLA